MDSPSVEQLALAVLGGAGFGALITFIGSGWQRLLLILVLLWTMQTGPQYLYRALDGTDMTQEVAIVTQLRVTFTIAAVLAVALGNRYRPKLDALVARWRTGRL